MGKYALIPVLLLAALNALALPQAVQQQLNNTEPVGTGRLRFMFVDVYNITLFGQDRGFNSKQLYALKIDYLVPIKGQAIADRTIVEIKKQPFNDAQKLMKWQRDMREFLPDVDKGVSLTGFKDGNGHTHFYHDEKWIGKIQDPQFTERFFAIWLGENASESKLRRQLLGNP